MLTHPIYICPSPDSTGLVGGRNTFANMVYCCVLLRVITGSCRSESCTLHFYFSRMIRPISRVINRANRLAGSIVQGRAINALLPVSVFLHLYLHV
ncbi:hypothetical protein GDO78_013304 [Eleutherodactylus coqui]|uniref:Uncharacterized protein n=1 Tax=Eleutherodactylus coqui TaxID=57060 RepID=A0A8J6K7E7_ELECQ|nr:hypothetical protein GDO78_013304 [Eleutherodactylus coqui]